MALTKTQVSELYVAIFNRASEGEGNKFWQENSTSVAQAADEMLETQAAKDYFGTSLDSDQNFIEHIYLNTLGKTVADDAEGIAFWVQALTDGASRGDVVAGLLEAARDPANAGDAQDQFINRVEVSDYTADNVETNPDDFAVSLSFKSQANPAGKLEVTADEDSVDAALDAVDNIGTSVPGEDKPTGAAEHDLEVGRDRITGEKDQANIFYADVAQNANGEQVNTLGSGDKLVGGSKEDTLDATMIDGLTVAGSAMDVTPTTSGIENIIINAQSSDLSGFIGGVVSLNARKMTDVEKIVSKHSDTDLIVKNMTTVGVGSTNKQTVGMEFTANNTASSIEASNMTVLYDQDYLTAGSQVENTLYYEMMNQDKDLVTTDLIEFPLGKITFSLNDVVYSLTPDIDVMMNDITTYAELADYLNELVAEKNWAFKEALKFSVGDSFTDPQGKTGQRILLTSTDKNLPITDPKTSISEDAKRGNYFWDADPLEATSSNDPVRINVELQKVGQAADGGALIIGSMNDEGSNTFDAGSTTVTSTREGFDQFDAVVKGGKERNSSLAELASTNNTLRKVTVKTEDERKENFANLTIGNSNNASVAAALGALGDSSAINADSLKDVQIFDASAFKGDLTLFAGITAETVQKYLDDEAGLNLTGDLNLGKELAQFTYNGGAGKDYINIQISEDVVEDTFVLNTATLDSTTKNTFKMNVNGGAGDDHIVVGIDAAATDTITNITINGGAGNDIINIENDAGTAVSTDATFAIAFNGNFGHDTILGFDVGAITITDEVQEIDLSGFIAHEGETITVSVGDKVYSYTATADMNQAAVQAFVVDVLTGTDTSSTGLNTMNTTEQYFSSSAAGTVLTLTGDVASTATTNGYEGKDVGTVKVEIHTGSETNVNYEKVPPLHSAVADTQAQGGLYEGAAGEDVLDFTAYGAKAFVVIDGIKSADGQPSAVHTTAFQASADATGGNVIMKGEAFLTFVQSVHNDEVYNVYLSNATDDVTGFAALDFVTEAAAPITNANAALGNVIGSIDLGIADWAGLTASQILI